MTEPSQAPKAKILLAADLPIAHSNTATEWLTHLAESFASPAVDVVLLMNVEYTDDFEPFAQNLEDNGVEMIWPKDTDESFFTEGRIDARYLARDVVRIGSSNQYDVVLTQGLLLSRTTSASGRLQAKHWALIDDDPLKPKALSLNDFKVVEQIATKCKLIFTSSNDVRASIDSRCAVATSKTRVFPSVFGAFGQLQQIAIEEHLSYEGTQTVVLDAGTWAEYTELLDISAIIESARNHKSPTRVIVVNSQVEQNSLPEKNSGLPLAEFQDYPGVSYSTGYGLDAHINDAVLLVPASIDWELNSVLWHRVATKARAVVTINDVLTSLTSHSLAQYHAHAAVEGSTSEQDFASAFGSDLPDYLAVPRQENPTKVLLAGADFKFAGDLVDTLIQRKDIEVKVDLFEANAKPQPDKSKLLLPWADVIIAEFASKNAIWYSHNIQPHQKLIVHLHGYELLQDWITELDIDNCSAIVVASEFYRQRAIEMRGWPEEKLLVVSNSVAAVDLTRKKNPEARFHIGIVGIVPILKRPDRALDLLEKLLAVDDRFVLHIKGHSPWNYAWEWKKAAHQDSYRQFYARIGANPDLLSHIAFEPFSPDVGNWLSKIGWLLSTSTRETFHLSAIEGSISGAVPIAWRRDGSEEIIGTDYNVDSTDEAVAMILKHASTEEAFAAASAAAIQNGKRYDVEKVRADWLSLIFSLHNDKRANIHGVEMTPAEAKVFRTVSAHLERQDFESALAVLDENIPLTRDAKGPLKDLELYARGCAAADERRIGSYFEGQRQEPKFARPLHIRVQDSANDVLTLAGADRTLLEIQPFNLLRDNYQAPKFTTDILPDHGHRKAGFVRNLRFDRWAQLIKASINQELADTDSDSIIVAGPWWLAYPAIMAANQSDLSVMWVIDDSESLEWIDSVSHGEMKTQFAANLAFEAYRAATATFAADTSMVPEQFPLGLLNGVLSEDPSAPLAVSPRQLREILADPDQLLKQTAVSVSGAVKNTQTPSFAQKPLAQLKVGIFGQAPQLSSALKNASVSVVSITSEGFLEEVSSQLDAVFVIGTVPGKLSKPMKSALCAAKETATTVAAKLFDRCRVVGVPGIFLWQDSEIIPSQLIASARKADSVATAWLPSLLPLLELHPTAIRGIAQVNTSASQISAIYEVMRSCNVSVFEPSLEEKGTDKPMQQHSDAPVIEESSPSEADLPNEKVLLIPTRVPFEFELTSIVARSEMPASLLDLPKMTARPSGAVSLHDLEKLIESSDSRYVYFIDPNDDDAISSLLHAWLDADDTGTTLPESASTVNNCEELYRELEAHTVISSETLSAWLSKRK